MFDAEELATEPDAVERRMGETFALQRSAFLADGRPSAELRRDRIARLIDLLLLNADPLVDALSADFGHRSGVQSVLSDVLAILPSLKSDYRHVADWMRPKRVSSGALALTGASARVEWTPRGVVGIVSPWNFPVALAVQPLSQAFAAGNRAMLKVSEFTPATGTLLQALIARAFDPAEATVVCGGPEVGAAFTSLPFDLMFFTGATEIARHVQRACAENLTPCVLELGGKSPAIIAPKADFALAAKRLGVGKMFNAGQICLSPDYVFAPAGRERAFADALLGAFSAMFPSLLANDDFSSVITPRHRQRLEAHVEDARAKGGEIVRFDPAGEDFTRQTANKHPLTLILNARPDMTVLQEEIFGPLLPIMGYDHVDEVIAFVNARPRPLAAYWFGPEDATCRRFLDRTVSGGVSINDVFAHVTNENLPFGGVGDSGMGSYHGRAGFETFSHARGVARVGWFSANSLMAPPYGPRLRRGLAWYLSRERRAAERRDARRRVA